MKEGNRVKHESFGYGTIAALPKTSNGHILVTWDTHKVERIAPKLTKNQTHVRPTSLTLISNSEK